MLKKLGYFFIMGAFMAPVFAQQKHSEGMWMPLKVKELNYADMQAYGLKLGADDIYSDKNVSVKDAIVRLNGGSCTAEIISSKGLLLTNHHCAYDAVASLSSVGSDFLTDGFWAKSTDQELPIPGAYISLLVRMEDVTTQILGEERDEKDETVIETRKSELIQKAKEGNDYSVEVKAMFAGGEYYLFVYQDFNDIRLVCAPPSSIGKYGGDTDNWMWPRHTGDFSMLRIYADKDNKPAAYSKDNKPYQPKKYLPISTAGVKEGDYSMVLGYPGSTDRYLTSDQINFALDNTNGDRVKLMGQKLEIMKKYMDKNDTVRIALASNYASLANYWKYLIGQTTMLKRYDIAGTKKYEESLFSKWANSGANVGKYGKVVSQIAELHKGYDKTDKFMNYLNFGLVGPQANLIGLSFMRVLMAAESKPDDKNILGATAGKSKEKVMELYKEFFAKVDKDLMAASLISFYNDIPKDMHPKVITDILTSKIAKKGKTPEDKIRLWVNNAFNVSICTNQKRAEAFYAAPTLKALQNDPVVQLMKGCITHFREKVAPSYGMFEGQLGELTKTYIKGLREMHTDKKFYPDANSTMRVTYGKVAAYYPKDGVYYDYYTTLDGVIEKEDNNNPEFVVPKKLHDLWASKDYGRWALPNGKLPTCFLTTNDITGGNSGSPVINGRGELIGCAFDGNWEAMAGDIYVNPNLNRTICVDIRYVLFLIDKFAGASNIIDELDIRTGKSED